MKYEVTIKFPIDAGSMDDAKGRTQEKLEGIEGYAVTSIKEFEPFKLTVFKNENAEGNTYYRAFYAPEKYIEITEISEGIESRFGMARIEDEAQATKFSELPEYITSEIKAQLAAEFLFLEV